GVFRFNTLSHPWVLLLLGVVAVVLAVEWLARAPGALNISTGETIARLPGGRRAAFARRVPALLRALGLALLIVALARPLSGERLRKDRANIIDIMLCLDVSGSMTQQDLYLGNRPRDRLYVAKEVVRDFVQSRKTRDSTRFGIDRIGLILYAGFAWTQCPLTLDYEVLARELELARVNEEDPRKNGTAIGSAIGLAVRRLTQSEAKSKVIILLTDGLNNRGELDPITAAEVAKSYGIRVYTIGAGSAEEGVTVGPGGLPMLANPIDEEALDKIARTTGGRYYRATSTELLRQAYAEISALETTEIEIGDFYE
ncbi:MAG TPA: VWA domain-containing protein, partial [Candidatus Hydrogenedentes bacterium]|nr:VWA domain-containing protein [Candidatus Hydrogenedentota bacterium]